MLYPAIPMGHLNIEQLQQQDRRKLITQGNAAESPKQIKAAKAALKSWQTTHPNDPAINTLLGALSMREAWLRMKHEWDY